MRVLVTGAGDYLGRRLLEALRQILPPDSRILGIERGPQPPLDGVTLLAVDPFDAASLAGAVAAFDPTIVFHLAALASVAQSSASPSYAWRADLLGTLNLAEAVARTRATLVFLSSTVVYGEAFRDRDRPDERVTPRPDTISGRTKNACEYILRDVLANAGVRHLVLRPSNYIGPGQSETFVVASLAGQIARIERGLAPPNLAVGDLSAGRDFFDVADFTGACLRVIERIDDLPDGGIFNVGSGVVTPVSEILDALLGMTGATVTLQVTPERLRPAGARREGCDPGAFAAATGWAPTIPLARSLATILAAARAGLG
ncbi:NAD-dependent epimerase/dehydratase family protein [Methylobacterium sp. J-070]|uniref:NAD-dependent epimerase/dehydratase family protein n=1 Tax=Methylobacterium sp. J-070 TaxID=2836650 RepID=UPI001FBA9E23|nr:NAD-dependent epimerase/dehydratase family protein [Methylobacterium sp. J-070]MCJ2048162.1 NAD-dependent epimerase/dehydratase family protein [Methylobacterium sp. J-070]